MEGRKGHRIGGRQKRMLNILTTEGEEKRYRGRETCYCGSKPPLQPGNHCHETVSIIHS
jgi:hypothetical protein